MLKNLYFGAELDYRSPMDGHLTRCIYIREENGRAVVMFQHAERVARVDFEQLEWFKYGNDALISGLQEYCVNLIKRNERLEKAYE